MSKLSLVIIGIVTFLVARPILQTGFFPIHDTTHIARVAQMETAIQGGVFPPLWSMDANFGYGYPLFHFYAPLAYYVALLAKLFLPTFLGAVKFSFLSALVVAALGIWKLSSQWGRGVGFLTTIAFILSPYLAVNLYVRGALAEIWAIALLPWLFYSWQTLTRSPRSIIKTSAVTALFLLSHNLIPLLTLPFFATWLILFRPQPLRILLYPALLTLALSSFYLAPLIFERHFVQVDDIARTTDYSLHFVAPWQLVNSTWGFGGSAPGVEDGMSFKLGKLHLLLAAASLLLLKRKSKNITPHLRFFLGSFLIAVFLATAFSKPLWDLIVPLQIVQFPWRALTLMIFFLSLLIGFSTLAIKNNLLKSAYIILATILLLVFNLKYFQPQTTIAVTDATYLEGDYIPATLATIIPEYLPSWMPDFPEQPSSADSLTLNFNFTSPQTIIHSRAYYPTWRATLNNQPLPLRPSTEGLIEFDLPAGRNQVVLSQTHTPLENYSFALTLLSIITCLYIGKRYT